MQLAEIFKTIVDSDAEDWKKTTKNHGGLEVAVHRNDVNLRIETSLEDEHVQNDNFHAPWANKFPDSSARGYFYDVYYGQSLIHRCILVSVDGARALLPLPRSLKSDVPLLTYKVAEIFDSGEMTRYLRDAGLSVESAYVEPE